MTLKKDLAAQKDGDIGKLGSYLVGVTLFIGTCCGMVKTLPTGTAIFASSLISCSASITAGTDHLQVNKKRMYGAGRIQVSVHSPSSYSRDDQYRPKATNSNFAGQYPVQAARYMPFDASISPSGNHFTSIPRVPEDAGDYSLMTRLSPLNATFCW